MAQPSETFDSYDAVGNREDLQNKIYLVSPESTPVLSAGRRFTATNKLHEWQRDTLAAPSASNAVIEGDDRTGSAIAPTVRVGNFTQLMDKVAVVSASQEKIKSAGRSSEMKYQVAKQYKELKRDVEARMLSKSPAVAGNSSTARQTGGLGVLIYTTALHNGAGATAAHTSGAPTAAVTGGTNRTFTEALVKTAMQGVYTQSGEMPTMISLSPAHKVVFSGFSGIAVNRYDIPKGKQAVVIGAADMYVSDFGTLAIVPNYIQATVATDVAYVLNPEYYGAAYLTGYNSVPLAKTGHTDKELVSVEMAVVVTAERALAKIDNLTP